MKAECLIVLNAMEMELAKNLCGKFAKSLYDAMDENRREHCNKQIDELMAKLNAAQGEIGETMVIYLAMVQNIIFSVMESSEVMAIEMGSQKEAH
jgi:hypothetical protein